jgi:hypothetical protein
VEQDKWWDQTQPKDIARAHTLAEAWKDHDPAALAASERIHTEVNNRYRINTHDVGADTAYLESGIETISANQARRVALAEHRKGMALIAAAQAEELRTKAEKLAPEIARHDVPLEYLTNPAMVQALQAAHDARTPGGYRSGRHHGEETPVPDRQRRHQRPDHGPAP